MKIHALIATILVNAAVWAAPKPPPSQPLEFLVPGYVANVKVTVVDEKGKVSKSSLTFGEMCNGSSLMEGQNMYTCHITRAYPLNVYWIDIFEETGQPIPFFDENGHRVGPTSIRCQNPGMGWSCVPTPRPL